jgi:hypothetical protein
MANELYSIMRSEGPPNDADEIIAEAVAEAERGRVLLQQRA